MAAYGAWIHEGKKPEEALDNVKKLLENTPVQAASAREALQAFASGEGDVLISYENEAITAQQGGEDIEYVRPPSRRSSSRTRSPRPRRPSRPRQPRRSSSTCTSEEGQKVFGEKGYRPVVDESLRHLRLRGAGRPVHHRGVRRMGRGRRRVLRPREGLGGEDPAGARGRDGWLIQPPQPCASRSRVRRCASCAPPVPAGTRAAASSVPGIVTSLPPRSWCSCRCRRSSGSRRATAPRRSPRRCRAQAQHALKFTLLSSLGVAAVAAITGTAHRLGARARPLPRQPRARHDHRPAVRAADHRRRPHAARDVRRQVAVRREHRLHAGDVVARCSSSRSRSSCGRCSRCSIELDRDAGGGCRSPRRPRLTTSGASSSPNLLPAILTGTGLAFAKAIGEFGSVVLITGNLPFDTEVALGLRLRADRERRHAGVRPRSAPCCSASRSWCSH